MGDHNMAREKVKSRLLVEWPEGEDRYRLLATADATPGYEDEYVIEKLGVDGLGEPRWDRCANVFRPVRDGANQPITARLIALVKYLLADERERMSRDESNPVQVILKDVIR